MKKKESTKKPKIFSPLDKDWDKDMEPHNKTSFYCILCDAYFVRAYYKDHETHPIFWVD